jgi:hypothetical protein
VRIVGKSLFCLVLACESRSTPLEVPEPEIIRPNRPPVVIPPEKDDLFLRDRILEVEIFIGVKEWERVRTQMLPPNLFTQRDCQAEPYPQFPFYEATVVIDRSIVESVGIRQNGFINELNEFVPPLEIRFDHYDPNQTFRGKRRMLLNSTPADPTSMRTCLAYDLFNRAGLAAPRCSFAAVRVNGQPLPNGSLGFVYTNVEAIDEGFLQDRFRTTGPIFEGKASDFRDGWMDTFDGPPDRRRLIALRDALQATDDQLDDRLSQVIDLDWFHEFWAIETIVGHWDGYSGNADRFFLFDHPENGLLFLPSSPQQAFYPFNPASRTEAPVSVLATGELARRLYLTPKGRQDHVDAMQAVLQIWTEAEIEKSIDEINSLIVERVQREEYKDSVDQLRAFVRDRRTAIEEELQRPVEWPFERRPTFCIVPRGHIDAQLSTTWDTLPQIGEEWQQIFVTGTGTVSAIYDDVIYTQVRTGAACGMQNGQVLFASISETTPNGGLVLYLGMDPSLYASGTFTIDSMLIGGQAAWYISELPTWIGYLYGTLQLELAGDAVDIHVTADIY